eukprot:6652100-Alexandrium_andersonii.AAC.1
MADTDAVASVPSCKHHIPCVRVRGGRQRRFVACLHTCDQQSSADSLHGVFGRPGCPVVCGL